MSETPPVPWIQYNEWPVCCDDYLTYIGEWGQDEFNNSAKNGDGLTLFIEYLQDNRVIFEHLSLTIAPAERVAIVGPSGSGKSTLLYLLSGLRKPTSGQVFLDDKEITAMDDSSEVRMKNFGFVFQQHYLIPYLSVLKNVLTGLPEKPGKEQVEQAMALLAELELTKEFNKLPHQLSGGQKQRVAIARALIRRPKIIFADEPTASLDKKTAIEVMDILRRQKDVTLVYNTHDLSLIKCTDRIIEIGKSNGVMSICKR